MDVPDIVEDVAGALHSVQDSAGAALNSSVGRVQDMGEALHSAAASVGRVQEVGTVLHSAAASMGRVQEVGTALHSAAASAGRVQEVGTALHSAAASVGRVAHTLPLPGVPTEPTGLPPEQLLRSPGLC